MTNAVLNAAVLGVLLVAAAPALRRMRPGPLVVTTVVLLALTVVFDSLMIAADLYVFDPSKILGVRVVGAPVEDLAYALAAALGVPVLWTVLGRRGGRGPRRPTRGDEER